MKRKQFVLELLKLTFPVFSGYVCLGIGFGILLEKAGYGVLWALLCSVLIYAGAMQYVTIGLLTGGASLLTAALTTIMVNARHLFYGISMIDQYKGAGKRKPYLIFGLTDETYSLVCNGYAPAGVDRTKFYFCLTALNQSYWVLGSVIGSLLGSAITFNTAGIDFAMTALFVTVFVDQWLSTKKHLSTMIGLISSIVCLVLFGSDNFLIPAMICIAVILSAGKPVIEPTKKEET